MLLGLVVWRFFFFSIRDGIRFYQVHYRPLEQHGMGFLDSLYLPLANRTGEDDIYVGNGDCAAWAAKAILVDVCGLEQ